MGDGPVGISLLLKQDGGKPPGPQPPAGRGGTFVPFLASLATATTIPFSAASTLGEAVPAKD